MSGDWSQAGKKVAQYLTAPVVAGPDRAGEEVDDFAMDEDGARLRSSRARESLVDGAAKN